MLFRKDAEVVPIQQVVRVSVLLSMAVVFRGGDVAGVGCARGDETGGPAVEQDSDCPQGESPKKSNSVLRAIASALGLLESEAEEAEEAEEEDATAKAMAEARAAYEEEQRKLQERLRSDPLWQPSHEEIGVIKVNEHAQGRPIHSFCLNGDGNLLVCCGPAVVDEPGGGLSFGSVAAPEKAADEAEQPADHGKILIFTPEGEKLGEWAVEFDPQAICLAGGDAVFVGGAGRLAVLDKDGKTLLAADSPNVAELPPLPQELKEGEQPPAEETEEEKKAKQETIESLHKQLQQAQEEMQNIAEEAGKNLNPEDSAAMEAFQEKIMEPQQKLMEIHAELQRLLETPEARAMRLRVERERRLTLSGMAVGERDLFLACRSNKGFGFAVWRIDREFNNPKKIVDNLSGCCGQMDIQSHGGDLWVAHNGRHKVEKFDREGKRLYRFGRRDRTSADAFGGCCEPKNLRFAANGDLFASESGPPTCVKRFTADGKFLGIVAVAPWDSGCVRVTTDFTAEPERFFVLNTGDSTIHVFAKKAADPAAVDANASVGEEVD